MNPRQAPGKTHLAVKLYLYPVFAGACIFLSFEHFNLFPVVFLMPFFLNGMRQLPTRQKLLAFWFMAIVANLGGYRWIGIVGTDFGGLPFLVSWGLVVLFALLNNLNFVLWAYLERFFGEKSSPFIIAALFCVAEQLNPQVFPWYFGTVLDKTLVLYQVADLFGVIGLSFVAMTLIHIPYWIWEHRKTLFTQNKMAFVRQLAFILFVVLYGIGALNRYDNEPKENGKSVGVSVIQSNTSMEKFYGAHLSQEQRLAEFQSIIDLSKQAIADHPDTTDLVIWPEGAVHFPILNYPDVFNAIAGLARDEGVYVTAGSVELGGRHENGRPIYYNTQFVVNPDGEIVGKYRKIVLLAFGEYIPFLDTFPILESWLPESISHFTRGTEKPVFALGDRVHWLPLICYEDIITGFIRGFDYRKADFMVNITNDGWFGKSHASHLHKQMARPRAVEYRKPLVRALNTGTSLIIDAAGRTISKETALFTQDYIDHTLHLPKEPPVTVYAMVGEWPIYGVIFVVVLLWLRQKFIRKGILEA